MDENYVLVVFSIVVKCGEIVINWPNYWFDTKVNNTLDFNKTSTDSNFGTSSPSLSWSTSFFVPPNNLIVLGDNYILFLF